MSAEKPTGHLAINSHTTIALSDEYGAQHYQRLGFVVQRAKDSYLWNPEGEKAFDGLGAYATDYWGHCWDVPVQALIRSLIDPSSQMDLTSNVVYTVPYAEFCKTIHEFFPGFDRVLAKSDGGSVTGSVVNAFRLHAEKRRIKNPEFIVYEHCFHGRDTIFQSLYRGMKTKWPTMVAVPRDPRAVEAAINKNTVGIFVETHLGEGGPIFDHDGSLYTAVHEIAKKYDIWRVDDDIQGGLYRCGDRSTCEKFGSQYRPDAATYAKALGGGVFPVSVLVGTQAFMEVFKEGTDGSTFGGCPQACSVAIAVMKDMMAHPLGTRAWEIGDRFVRNLSGIPYVTVENEGALVSLVIDGIKSAWPLSHEMVSGNHGRPRAVIKPGHVYGGKAYMRIAVPMGTTTDDMIDYYSTKTIRPILEQTSEMIDRSSRDVPIDISF